MKKLLYVAMTVILTFSYSKVTLADGHVYGPYPITLKDYSGDKTNSVKYTGQMARHVLHDSLKALVKTGDVSKMMAYYNGEDGLEIVAPKSKDDFVIKQTMVSEIGSGNLSAKFRCQFFYKTLAAHRTSPLSNIFIFNAIPHLDQSDRLDILPTRQPTRIPAAT